MPTMPKESTSLALRSALRPLDAAAAASRKDVEESAPSRRSLACPKSPTFCRAPF